MGSRRVVVAVVVVIAALVAPAAASAHIERASYWPDPAADCTISPCAGGKVPKARSLASALDRSAVGDTRVVCKPDSIARLKRAISRALRRGYDIRPHDHRSFGRKAAAKLLRLNRRLYARCHFRQIQPAVTASANNDRVVVLPGIYTEPSARAKPTNDPACADYRIKNDKGSSGAVSYEYQVKCPNDQNLIAVIGRSLGTGTDPAQPLEDRHNIPNLGKCVRCNLQLEGSGVSADDVIIDGGRVASGNKGPAEPVKDVGVRGDRADGFVLRNMTVRHVKEHAIYLIETEGYRLSRFKTYYAEEYGVLTFVGDHGLMEDCEAAGSGDSGLYPGSGADTGAQRLPGTKFRYSQRITRCDSHHNAGGYSGTNGNATHVDHNNFYDNALGFTTDVFTAAGHPGFPQDSDLIEHNRFYDNNFNVYAKDSDVVPTVPVPVGTGLWIAGGNDNVIRDNWFYDNWRRGAMLFAVPDSTICGAGVTAQITGCDPEKLSTSFRNRFSGNIMGVAPNGKARPNGVDWWWDDFPGTTGNCWYDNKAVAGGTITSAPSVLPDCAGGTQPASSVGKGDGTNELELLTCFDVLQKNGYDPAGCPWFAAPAKPGSAAATAGQRRYGAAVRRLSVTPEAKQALCRVWHDRRPLRCGAF